MNATQFEIATTEKSSFFTINYADAITSGYGHKKITVEIEFEGEYEKFSATTSFMPDYDKAMDLDGQEKYEALYACIEQDINEDVFEWLMSII